MWEPWEEKSASQLGQTDGRQDDGNPLPETRGSKRGRGAFVVIVCLKADNEFSFEFF